MSRTLLLLLPWMKDPNTSIIKISPIFITDRVSFTIDLQSKLILFYL